MEGTVLESSLFWSEYAPKAQKTAASISDSSPPHNPKVVGSNPAPATNLIG